MTATSISEGIRQFWDDEASYDTSPSRYPRRTRRWRRSAAGWRGLPRGCCGGCEPQARQALGEAAFQAACHRGRELPADGAVACALQQRPAKPPAPAVSDGAPLMPRELQVARLIAGGCSNKQIAAAVVISQRTAENHVEHILAKLGLTARAQVAGWAAASQPAGEGRFAAHGVQAPAVSVVRGP